MSGGKWFFVYRFRAISRGNTAVLVFYLQALSLLEAGVYSYENDILQKISQFMGKYKIIEVIDILTPVWATRKHCLLFIIGSPPSE